MKDGCPMCAEIGAHCGRHDEEPTDSGIFDTPECDRCARSRGLCARHRKGILPQLAQPFWYKLVGTMHHDEETEMSPEARRVYNRKRTKAARRATADKARAKALDSFKPAA